MDTIAMIVGHSSNVMALGAATINLSNVPITAIGTAVTAASRRIYIAPSSRRWKLNIEDAAIDPASVLALQPVTFLDRYQCEQMGTQDGATRFLGMIAEDVAETPCGPWLVHYEDGEPFSLAYEKLPVLQQVVLVDHEERVVTLEATVTDLTARLTALEAW